MEDLDFERRSDVDSIEIPDPCEGVECRRCSVGVPARMSYTEQYQRNFLASYRTSRAVRAKSRGLANTEHAKITQTIEKT